ncbi:polysaccharide pyruvyl transferase family protein [Bacillus massiliglaciei]|uniref:polysaccharide pyruvyl transferase family protein n=1 Tax=Bacillus massiliglaciei TaxID=1816693 RepID=UPI000DA5FC9B|nr:polysaccharide pyruvyl transferase family protein [Bacillus massiliglaciei]
MKKILIINAHSSKNKGDAAIIISMIQSLKKFIPDAKLTVSSRYPEDDDIYKEYGCDVVEQITRFPGKNLSFVKRLNFLLNEISDVNKFHKNNVVPSNRNPEIFEAYTNADLIISCGGGFLYSHPKYHIEASLIMHLAQIYFAKKLGKKVLIYSQSIGPFRSKLSKKIANNVLKKVDVITIREKLSKGFLEEININNSVIVGDSAFVMGYNQEVAKENELIEINNNQLNVGITVRQWVFPGKENTKYFYEKYIKSVAETIELLINKYDANVYLVPQVTGPTPIEDDRISNNHILEKLSNNIKEKVNTLKKDYSPQELKTIYSKFDIFIGTRMHSNIFSLSSQVPTVAISYEPKTTGIMQSLGLSEFVVEINDITPEELKSKTVKCIENHTNYKNSLSNIIPKIVEEAEKPALIARDLIK